MKILLCSLVILAMALPLVFRRVFWIRGTCVALLGFLATLHLTFLLAEHRLVLDRGIQHFGASPEKPLPDDFRIAVGMVQEFSHGELLFTATLFVAFAVLALLPFYRSEKNVMSHNRASTS